MHLQINESQILKRLDENGLKYKFLELQNGIFVIISERGGHIFGPFLEKGGNSLLWMNPVFADEIGFKQFVAENHWNMGGDRNWIAPEIQYITLNRSDPNKVSISTKMDPGAYILEKSNPSEFFLHQDMTLVARNVAMGEKKLHIETHIRPTEDPMRYLKAYPSLIENIRFIGYEQTVKLSEYKTDGIMSELWNFAQLNPEGEILVPISPAFEITNYTTQPIDPAHYKYDKNLLRIKIDGTYMYKIGLKAAHFTGRLGYLAKSDSKTSYLLIRNFFNNPSSYYIEEPAWSVGQWGDSVHIYNDGGKWGGFGELEVHGQTIGGVTGKSESVDLIQMWIYIGEPDKLQSIAENLLGIE